MVNYDRLSATDAQGGNSVLMLLRLLRQCGAARVLLAGADGYRPGTAAYADEGLHTHTGRGAAYNAQMAGAIRAGGPARANSSPPASTRGPDDDTTAGAGRGRHDDRRRRLLRRHRQ